MCGAQNGTKKKDGTGRYSRHNLWCARPKLAEKKVCMGIVKVVTRRTRCRVHAYTRNTSLLVSSDDGMKVGVAKLKQKTVKVFDKM